MVKPPYTRFNIRLPETSPHIIDQSIALSRSSMQSIFFEHKCDREQAAEPVPKKDGRTHTPLPDSPTNPFSPRAKRTHTTKGALCFPTLVVMGGYEILSNNKLCTHVVPAAGILLNRERELRGEGVCRLDRNQRNSHKFPDKISEVAGICSRIIERNQKKLQRTTTQRRNSQFLHNQNQIE